MQSACIGKISESPQKQARTLAAGLSIPTKPLRAARKEEVGYMEERGIWELRPISESYERTGKGPVSVRWVDTNKGTKEEMLVRSRMVARESEEGDRSGRSVRGHPAFREQEDALKEGSHPQGQ